MDLTKHPIDDISRADRIAVYTLMLVLLKFDVMQVKDVDQILNDMLFFNLR